MRKVCSLCVRCSFADPSLGILVLFEGNFRSNQRGKWSGNYEVSTSKGGANKNEITRDDYMKVRFMGVRTCYVPAMLFVPKGTVKNVLRFNV